MSRRGGRDFLINLLHHRNLECKSSHILETRDRSIFHRRYTGPRSPSPSFAFRPRHYSTCPRPPNVVSTHQGAFTTFSDPPIERGTPLSSDLGARISNTCWHRGAQIQNFAESPAHPLANLLSDPLLSSSPPRFPSYPVRWIPPPPPPA